MKFMCYIYLCSRGGISGTRACSGCFHETVSEQKRIAMGGFAREQYAL